ncbi:MAG: ATP-binding cassette domain-containing protein, partial [Kiritimatiellae bacterium]|nr:ATP-binding cassette domain-containing protein [Kiritimatiellia bacterium]
PEKPHCSTSPPCLIIPPAATSSSTPSAPGLSPEALAVLRREKIGMVFQRFHLLNRRTALENVAFRFRYAPETRSEAHRLAAAALDHVGLAAVAHRIVRLMSGGEMQRTAIARAIAKPPLILFADEPTGNLDSENTARIMELFQQINREGIAILLATHNKALLPFCSRHFVCTDGHLIEEPLPA